MKALMYEGPRKMPLVDIPEPEPAPNEVKIAVKYTGICGSDVHGYTGASGRKIPPMIMGHEFSGKVHSVGSQVSKFKVGDRVTVQPIMFCGVCEFCKQGLQNICANRRGLGVLDVNGSFTEYICIPETNVYHIPDTMDYKEAALIEPLSVAYRAVHHIMPVKDKVVMIAGGGVIGLLILTLVKYYGAKKVLLTDLNDNRLQVAKNSGADIVINPKFESLDQVIENEGLRNKIDITIECVGASVTAQSTIEAVRSNGTVLWVGNAAKMITIDMQQVVTREVQIKSTYGFTPEDFQNALKLLESGELNISGFVTKIVSLEDATAEFETLSNGGGNDIKVLVESNPELK